MDIKSIQQKSQEIISNVSKVIVGKEETVRLILSAILADGHVLIEDSPGTGKTMLAKAVAKSFDGDFRRIQFVPDLMPSDITGLNIYNQKQGEFELVKGPVFTNVLLADEINRATPRTQSSLLEAMEEKQVTIDGVTMKLDNPFIVIATENPLEQAGTYPLPEAQLDRFSMRLCMGNITKEEQLFVIDRFINDNPIERLEAVCTPDELIAMKKDVKNVYVHAVVREYIVNIVNALRDNKNTGFVSTRGMLMLVSCAQAYSAIMGKEYVSPDTVKYIAPYVFGHRVSSYRSGVNGMDNVRAVLENVEAPVENWEER